jgi:hypothetical protein
MAVASTTASSATATPRAIHAGLNVATATYTLNAAASTTLSDVLLMVKIPDQATIVDGYVVGTNGSAATTFKIGTSADDDALHVAASFSATAQLTRFSAATLPFKVSISDDAEPKWTYVKMERTANASGTLTESIRLVVKYVMPGNI